MLFMIFPVVEEEVWESLTSIYSLHCIIYLLVHIIFEGKKNFVVLLQEIISDGKYSTWPGNNKGYGGNSKKIHIIITHQAKYFYHFLYYCRGGTPLPVHPPFHLCLHPHEPHMILYETCLTWTAMCCASYQGFKTCLPTFRSVFSTCLPQCVVCLLFFYSGQVFGRSPPPKMARDVFITCVLRPPWLSWYPPLFSCTHPWLE